MQSALRPTLRFLKEKLWVGFGVKVFCPQQEPRAQRVAHSDPGASTVVLWPAHRRIWNLMGLVLGVREGPVVKSRKGLLGSFVLWPKR